MNSKIIILMVVAVGIVGAIFYLQSSKSTISISDNINAQEVALMGKEEKAKQYEPAKEISSPDGFINTPLTSSGQASSITIQEFIGKKIVLVDFWTYSCINCQRTLPYLNAWHEKYADKGLVILGLHTPEFEFEKDFENVKKAVEKFDVKYPVVLDNDFSTWRSYKNQYWPRKYLIDIDGFIVYDHIGEGAYDETEKKIQELLQERKQVLGLEEKIEDGISNPKNAVTVKSGGVGSPEVYFGAFRNELLANGAALTEGKQTFSVPEIVQPNELYLTGDWDITREYAENSTSGASIVFFYKSKDVYFVASAPNGVKADIYRDKKLVKTITIKEDQLYELINGEDYSEHVLEIRIENPGLRAFTFTFG